MRVYPAIDIKDGKCVRLRQGVFADTTVFDDDPSRAAQKWRDAGANCIHVVDLDGARYGSGYNNEAIKKILAVGLPIQVGGGVRSMNDVEEKLDMGVWRVIIGTAAIKDRAFVERALATYGDRIAIGIDASNGKVAIEGWEEVSEKDAVELCLDVKELGAETIIYTDIAKDGMMSGPNIESTKEIIDKTGISIVASGGISTMDDLEKVKKIKSSGVIIGKALYIGALDLKRVIEAFETEE